MSARPTECPLFGAAQTLPTDRLPTYSDVLRYYKIVNDRIKLQTNSKKNPDIRAVNNQIRDDLMLLWHKARLFHTDPNSIYGKLVRLKKKYAKHLKYAKDKRAKRSETLLALHKFRLKGDRLFDITRKCKCTGTDPHCQMCSNTVLRDWHFLLDQRGPRLQTITVDGGRDLEWQDTLDRLEKEKIKAAA